MTFDEYQEFAKKDWKPGCDDITFALGLGGETGEVLDILKKARRDCKEPDKEHLAEELGDVLWYMANLCTAFGFSLRNIAAMNMGKLQKRYGTASAFRRNGPHIEQIDPATGKHIRFCKRTEFTAEELEEFDNAHRAVWTIQGQDSTVAERIENLMEEKNDTATDCPFD